jgi:hypothetical protein
MGPSRTRRGGRRSDRSNLWAGLALAAAVALVGLYFGASFWAREQRVEIDEASLCPKSGPTAVTAVLVDRSDPLSPQQAQRVRQVLERIVEEASVGGRVALYVAEADAFAALSPVLALCNPGSEANPLYQNPKKIRARYEDGFKARFEAVRGALLEPARRQSSPVMESIKAVCIDAFGKAPAGVPLRLVVVSDLLQHSPITSHYRERNFEAVFKDGRLAGVLVDCKGAEVDILYVLRLGKDGRPTVQTRDHQRFWDLYFQRLNARPKSLEAV